MGNFRIDTAVGRERLIIRPAPYFVKIGKGLSIGYRKNKTTGSWVARHIKDGQRKSKVLEVSCNDPGNEYFVASNAAHEWLRQEEQGVDTEYLLQDAVDDYIEYLKREKSKDVYKTAAAVLRTTPQKLRRTPVHKLTTRQLDKWRISFLQQGDAETVRRSKNTCNRRWSDLRACLNRSFQQGYVADKTAWERIQPFKKVQRGRQIFWTVEEVNELLKVAKLKNKDFHNLLKGALLTGCRVGELRTIRVKHFDRKNEQVEVAGKTGFRDMEMSPSAVSFFLEMSKNKLPEAFLFDYRGRQWPDDYHHKLFRKIRSLVNIDQESTFYCARHYYISQGLKTGVSVDLVAKNVGTSPAMIHQFYGKFTKQAQKSAAAQVDAALGIE